MENKKIKDSAITASSEYNSNFKAIAGRLNAKPYSWAAASATQHQWFQVDFSKPTKITGIATQGRNDWWLKSYYLSYSQDGLVFDSYENRKAIIGNLYHNVIVSHIIKPAIIARYIRVNPMSWHGHPAMRVEFYGCTSGFVAPPPPSCVHVMGLEKGWVPNFAMTASSSYASGFGPYNARLNFKAGAGRVGAWCAGRHDRDPWLQVNFQRMMVLTRVATQGRQDAKQWVKTYTLSYSIDGKGKFIDHKVNGKVKVFHGNWENTIVVINRISPEIVAQFVRINPKTSYSYTSLRAEFWGCKAAVPLITTPVIKGYNKAGKKRRPNAAGKMGARCSWTVKDNPIVKGSPPAKYQVQWVKNGKAKPVVNLGNSARSADLECGAKGFKAGDNVACKVRGKYDIKEHWSSYRTSQEYNTGITVFPRQIIVSEGSLSATVTVCTDMKTCCDDPDKEECQVVLEFKHMDDIITDKCQIVLKPGKRCTTFKVRAVRDFLDDGTRREELKFKPVKAPNCSCWDGYKPPSVMVTTIDATHSICSSCGDPHITTFDKRVYHQLTGGNGTFVFIKSLARTFEAQVKVWRCWSVLCNCGIAVRENNDVLVYDGCGGVPRVVQKSPGQLSKGVRVSRNGNKDTMTFPSGAEIQVTQYSWGICLVAKVPGVDKKSTEGQCGNNNGNKNDDFNGISQAAFLNSLRVPANKDLFRTIPKVDGSGGNEEKFDCECKKQLGLAYQDCGVRHTGEAKGKPVTPVTADGGGIVPPANGAHKRDEILVKRVVGASWPTKSGKTEAQVRAHCKKVLAGSKTGKACLSIGQDISHIIDGCVIDVQMADMLEMSAVAFDELVSECKDAVLRNPANYKGNSTKPSTGLLDVLCPGDCSGHGTCKAGKCTCESGYYENDCSKDITQPPVLKAMLATCDVNKWPCKKIAIVGDGYVETDMLSCHMSKKLLQGKSKAKESKSPSTYSSFREVLCNLPIQYKAGRKFAGPLKIDIKISNDGKAKSNAKSLIVYDSRCFECADNGKCKQKSGICVINHVCYTSGEKNPSNAELVCNPSKSTGSWHDTGVKPTTAAPTKPPTKVQ